MAKVKRLRERGKISLSRYFQNLREGDVVSVVIEPAVPINFPERIHGKTGVVENKRGRAFIIKIKDQNKEKRFIIDPVHLKRIKTVVSK